MTLTIQTNTAAMTALKHLNINTSSMDKSLEKLASGFRVNNAADDASGFAVSSKLDAQTQRLKAASLNATQAQAMTKMADAGVNEIQNMVVRIQTLATQASSANNAGELGKLDAERIKLESAIDKIAHSSNYNGVNLLNGIDANIAGATGTAATGIANPVLSAPVTSIVSSSGIYENASFTVHEIGSAYDSVTSNQDLLDMNGELIATAGTELLLGGASVTITPNGSNTTINLVGGASLVMQDQPIPGADFTTFDTTGATAGVSAKYTAALAFQVGADNTSNNQISVDLTNSYTTTALGLGGGDLTTQANAQAYIDTVKAALDTIVTQRADLGATQNQVAFVQANLATSIEQTTAAVSSIRDADMASEMAAFTKNQILTQASTTMLAQANQAAQNVMTLFR
ncbi:MAG: flagellar protein [Zetaproteobacteria bacterium CG2_30_46_52]|nr:MAG: flagellar protein [Zetaproteobacteria bacterium CG2_30_46_52]